jgi:hypothetical protein
MDPLLVVISSSASGEDVALRDALEAQLQSLVRQGLIRVWHAGHVRAGEVTCEVTLKKLREAPIILLLITPDYLGSEEHEHELKTALARAAQARVMPIRGRPCTLHGTPLGAMKMLPEGGQPVTKWTLLDDAWASVVRSVRDAVSDVRAGKSHYVPVDVLQTAPMAPVGVAFAGTSLPPMVPPPAASPSSGAPPTRITPLLANPALSTPLPASVRDAAVSSARPSLVSVPPATPGPVALSLREPARPPTAPTRRHSRTSALGMLVLGALIATLGWASWVLIYAQGSTHAGALTDDPSPMATSRPVPTVPSPSSDSPAAEKRVCCGGVDCPEAERNMAGSWCEKNPAYCITCPSRRKRVDGACAAPLAGTAKYRIRTGQALLNGVSVDATARICLRRNGSPEPETCSTAADSRAGMATAHPWPLTVSELTMGPGVDFRIEIGGSVIAEERGAIVHAGGLKVGALCGGVVLRGSGGSGGAVTIFLDDP